MATLEDALEVASRQGPVAVVTLEGETLRGAMVEGGRGSVKGKAECLRAAGVHVAEKFDDILEGLS